jgi:hypothetical protein
VGVTKDATHFDACNKAEGKRCWRGCESSRKAWASLNSRVVKDDQSGCLEQQQLWQMTGGEEMGGGRRERDCLGEEGLQPGQSLPLLLCSGGNAPLPGFERHVTACYVPAAASDSPYSPETCLDHHKAEDAYLEGADLSMQ